MKIKSIIVAICGLAAPAWAQDAPSPLDPLYACRAIADPGARLACFDQNAAQIQSDERTGAVVSIDKTKAASIQRKAFGFSLPALPKLGLPSGGAEIETIEALLLGMTPLGEGQFMYTLDNGQVWVQIDDRIERAKLPNTVTIKKAAMGSFLLKVGDQRAVRVKRAQ